MIEECPNCDKKVVFPRKIFIQGDVPFDENGIFYPMQDAWVYFLFECKCGASWAIICEVP